MLIVILSFVSFWIDHKSVRLNQKKNSSELSTITYAYIQVPARISVGLLTVLTVTTQSSGNQSFLMLILPSSFSIFLSLSLILLFHFILTCLLAYLITPVEKKRNFFSFLFPMHEFSFWLKNLFCLLFSSLPFICL